MRVVDKLDKMPADRVRALLVERGGPDRRAGRPVLALAAIRAADDSFVGPGPRPGRPARPARRGARRAGPAGRGCADLDTDRVSVEADLRIARGLDYYTGTVFETRMDGFESLGSICSGGRYDALASDGRTTLPRRRHLARRHPDAGAAVRPQRADRQPVGAVRGAGRAARRGVPRRPATPSPPRCGPVASPARWSPVAQKFGKQIRYAERRGIPYVWFPALTPTPARTRSRTSAPATRSTPIRRPGAHPLRTCARRW